MVLLSRLKRLLTLIKNGSLSSACAFVRKPNAQRPMTSKVKHWKRLQPKILKLNCCHNEISEEKICKFSLLVYYYFFFFVCLLINVQRLAALCLFVHALQQLVCALVHDSKHLFEFSSTEGWGQ